ncbi:MAG: hypothetical protein QXQ53_09105 [Candidatus Methanosuratincola sp.]
MFWLWVPLFLPDSLSGVQYQWLGLKDLDDELCAEVQILSTDRPLLLVWQEAVSEGRWTEVRQVQVDRWAKGNKYSVCRKGGAPGTKVRVILRGITPQSPQATLYEGTPWGAPMLSPDISLERGDKLVLRVSITYPGAYILRAFNRFGEEIFTIPVELHAPQELKYAVPSSLQGAFLIQLYSVNFQRVVVEKSLRI